MGHNTNNVPKFDTSDKVSSPKLVVLQKHIESIDHAIDQDEPPQFTERELVELRDALYWTYTNLSNRKDYHKRHQQVNKTKDRLMREALEKAGVSVKAIEKAAVQGADDYIIDNTSDLESFDRNALEAAGVAIEGGDE